MSAEAAWLRCDFFAQDPLVVARALLGAELVHQHPERGLLAATIVETECYRGEEDQACHARAGRTPRTEVMYGPPGIAYVYLVYGMHYLLNVTAWPEGRPAAVLLRAAAATRGLPYDISLRGPAKLTKALDIDLRHNRLPMDGRVLGLRAAPPLSESEVKSGPRIGVDYAGEWSAVPWRFYLHNHPCVSRVPQRRR